MTCAAGVGLPKLCSGAPFPPWRSTVVARSVAMLACASIVTGCAVPNLGARPTPITAQQVSGGSNLAGTGAWPSDAWWSTFGDPQLSGLIAEGLTRSPDLASATARLASADALAREARASFLPSLIAQGSAGVAKQSYNAGIPRDFVPKGWKEAGTVNVQGVFDIDPWGRNRAEARAALSEADAAALEVAQARLVLTTGIASTYAELIRLGAQREVELATLRVRSDTERLVSQRVTNGLDTQAELKQAVAAVPAARAELGATDEAIALVKNQLAALVGQGPGRAATITTPTALRAVHDLPAGVTTDLLARRPDVQAALARVEAASARIKVARTAFYPSFSLQGLIGLQALGFGNVFKSGSTYGNAGPAISLPIFQGGALRARYRGARATYDGAVADYDATVIEAYRQVADVAASRAALSRRLADAQAALRAAGQAAEVARLRYEGGLSTYLDVLTAQNAVLQNQRVAADLTARAFTLDVALVRALGGGFTPPTSAADAANRKDDDLG